MDDLDRCCLEHARCYGRTVRQCPDVWKKPYDHMYAWTVLEDEVTCGKYSFNMVSLNLQKKTNDLISLQQTFTSNSIRK